VIEAKMTSKFNDLIIGPCSLPRISVACDCISDEGMREGTFDENGYACFIVPPRLKHYISVSIYNVTDAVLLDENNHRLRSLVRSGPKDGEHKFVFTLPTQKSLSLIISGMEGTAWRFDWQIYKAMTLAPIQEKVPDSKLLRELSLKLVKYCNSDKFWHNIEHQGTPLVETIDNNKKLVTFLWRGVHDNVFISGSPSGQHDPMFKIANSDIWFRSYVVPADTLLQYQFAPDVPRLEKNPEEQWRAILGNAQVDPLNPNTTDYVYEDPWNSFSLVNISLTPRYFSHEKMGRSISLGSLTHHTIFSDYLGNSREITLYRPAANAPIGWTLLLFDGQIYQKIWHISNVIEQLIASHILPPINVVLIDSLDLTRRGRELPPNIAFSNFMAHELLPWLRQKNIAVEPDKTIIAGSSFGGIAASWVALRYPSLFANVISLSGSYWWAPKEDAPGWLTREYTKSSRYPIRFWIQAGKFETAGPNGGNYINNLEFYNILKDKGYEVSFHSWHSGHNYVAWCEALVDGIRDLIDLDEVIQ